MNLIILVTDSKHLNPGMNQIPATKIANTLNVYSVDQS